MTSCLVSKMHMTLFSTIDLVIIFALVALSYFIRHGVITFIILLLYLLMYINDNLLFSVDIDTNYVTLIGRWAEFFKKLDINSKGLRIK